MSPRGRRMIALASLYIAQGLPFGFFVQALPVLLRERGTSLPAIGLASLLALPWALKPFLAPLVDRVASRRAWLVPLQVASAGLLAIASLVPPERGLVALFVIVALTNVVAAAQDVATDALAIDLLPEGERGLGNGIQVGGYRVGMIVGGGAILGAMATIGWSASMLALAALLALTSLPLAMIDEPARPVRPARPAMSELRAALVRPGAVRWARVLVLFKAGEALAMSMIRPMLVDAGLDTTDLAALFGGTGFVAGLLGALAGGVLSTKLGRKRALVACGVLQLAGIAAWLVPAHGVVDLPTLHVVCGFEHFVAGMATAALFTAMMDACRPDHAATDYALQASAVVVAAGLASAIGGVSAATLGHPGHLALAMGIATLGLVEVARSPAPISSEVALAPILRRV